MFEIICNVHNEHKGAVTETYTSEKCYHFGSSLDIGLFKTCVPAQTPSTKGTVHKCPMHSTQITINLEKKTFKPQCLPIKPKKNKGSR